MNQFTLILSMPDLTILRRDSADVVKSNRGTVYMPVGYYMKASTGRWYHLIPRLGHCSLMNAKAKYVLNNAYESLHLDKGGAE